MSAQYHITELHTSWKGKDAEGGSEKFTWFSGSPKHHPQSASLQLILGRLTFLSSLWDGAITTEVGISMILNSLKHLKEQIITWHTPL